MKNNIINCEKNEIISEMSLFAPIAITLISIIIDEICEIDTYIFVMVYLVKATFSIIYIIAIIIYYNYKNSKVIKYRAFNSICLDILEKVEKENELYKLNAQKQKIRKRQSKRYNNYFIKQKHIAKR
ncbi:hypothetical protein [Clostridium botulinum]